MSHLGHWGVFSFNFGCSSTCTVLYYIQPHRHHSHLDSTSGARDRQITRFWCGCVDCSASTTSLSIFGIFLLSRHNYNTSKWHRATHLSFHFNYGFVVTRIRPVCQFYWTATPLLLQGCLARRGFGGPVKVFVSKEEASNLHNVVCSRFILNLPDEELASLERICFQVEQASVFPATRNFHRPDPFLLSDIGFMKISFANKIQCSLRCRSRSFLPCFSMLALFSTSGAMITKMLSISSCSTRLVYLYAEPSCWIVLGIKWVV